MCNHSNGPQIVIKKKYLNVLKKDCRIGKIKHFFLNKKESSFESKTKLKYTHKNEYFYFRKQTELRLGPEMVLKTKHVTKK